MLAAEAALASEQRSGDRLHGVHRSDLVGRSHPDELRLAVGSVGLHRGQARVGLDHRVVGTLGRIRPGGPETGQRRVDEIVTAFAQRFVAEAEAVHHAGTEVLDDDVGPTGQLPGDLAPAFGVEADRDRALATVAGLVQRGDAVDRDPDPARDVADTGTFDLDHGCALIGEQRGGVGSGERSREVDDAHARHRTGMSHCLAHGMNSFCDLGRPPGPLYASPLPGRTANSTSGIALRQVCQAPIKRSSAG